MALNYFSFHRRLLNQIDWWIVGALLALTAFGILVIDGTTFADEYRAGYARRQMMWWGVSLVCFVVILLMDYSQLVKPSVVGYLACLACLVYLLYQSKVIKGAASWIDLRVIRFQPSEFTKIATVVAVAAYLAWIKRRLPGYFDMAVVAAIVLLPFLLIALQPDLGTAAVFLTLIIVMPWAAGARPRIYAVLLAVCLLATTVYATAVVVRGGDYPFLKPYQEVRLRAFFERMIPKGRKGSEESELIESMRGRAGWAPLQARIALGSGQWFGRGWRKGTQTRLDFLPEAHTDYVFSSCGEQFGFAGCAFVLALYTLLIYRSMFVALRSKDWFGYLIVVGFLTVFVTHVFLNIGVATDLLPVTGLPLPLMSYGGSFLLTTYVGFALVVNVGMRKYMF